MVVAASKKTLAELAAGWRDAGVRTTRLAVSHGFHSALMEPMLADFGAVLAGLRFHQPVLAGLPAGVSDPDFWLRQVRDPVRFADAVTGLAASGVTRWLELGPDAVLTPLTAQILDAQPEADKTPAGPGTVVAAMRPGRSWWKTRFG